MAKCSWCNHEMMDENTISCVSNEVVDFNDVILPSIPFCGDELESRCHDCNVKDGGFHHPGCDSECCPKCGGQLISCGCLEV